MTQVRPVARPASVPGAEPVQGLSEAEARQRPADGRGNTVTVPTSRPVRDILRTNVLTRFNALLGGLLVVILIVGPLQDALFGFVLVINSAIGVAQELRARRTLDRLALVRAPHARVVRAGVVRRVALGDVVKATCWSWPRVIRRPSTARSSRGRWRSTSRSSPASRHRCPRP